MSGLERMPFLLSFWVQFVDYPRVCRQIRWAENMKVSGFTFIRNGEMLGFPFVESVKSALPVCDEFVVNVGKSAGNPLGRIKAIVSGLGFSGKHFKRVRVA